MFHNNNINILPLNKGVMADYHTKKKLSPKTKSSVIIYHNTCIHGQYITLKKYFFQWYRFTVKNSLLLNFNCFSLFAFILFILMFMPERVLSFFGSAIFGHSGCSFHTSSHVAMYGWDIRRNYNMLLSMGGAYRNYGKLMQ
jgi:hypothetical protein